MLGLAANARQGANRACSRPMGKFMSLRAVGILANPLQLVGLFSSSAVQLQTLSELRINIVLALRSGAASATPVAEHSIAILTRHIRLFGKFFRRLQQLDAKRFVALPSCGDLILYYWSKVVQATNSPNDQIAGMLKSHTAIFI